MQSLKTEKCSMKTEKLILRWEGFFGDISCEVCATNEGDVMKYFDKFAKALKKEVSKVQYEH